VRQSYLDSECSLGSAVQAVLVWLYWEYCLTTYAESIARLYAPVSYSGLPNLGRGYYLFMPKKPVSSSAKHAEHFVKLSVRGANRLLARHPWVYRSDIVEGKDIPFGALVRVLDPRGKFLGSALYSSSSQIAIRMISHGPVADLPALIAERIRAAIGYRKENNLIAKSDSYRVVFSEADFLPGLIVDRYNDVLTLQILTQGMDAAPVREAIVRTLREELQPAGIVERVEARIRELEQLPPLASGLPSPAPSCRRAHGSPSWISISRPLMPRPVTSTKKPKLRTSVTRPA